MGESGVSGKLFAACAAVLLFASFVQADTWTSPLLNQELILLEKTPMGDPSPPRPLPAILQSQLGQDAVEYESFVAVRMPSASARKLMDAADAEGYGWLRDTRPPISLPFHSFAPESPGERSRDWEGHGLHPEPVKGLFIVQFAFPEALQHLDSGRESLFRGGLPAGVMTASWPCESSPLRQTWRPWPPTRPGIS
jgi:hypothetical protein